MHDSDGLSKSMTLRVLHVMGELKLSGAEFMLHSAANELHAKRATILATGPNEGEFAPALREAGYTVIHEPFKKSLLFFQRFATILKKNQFDLVHIHTEQARIWYIVMSRALKLPVITTIHNQFTFHGLLRLRRKIERKFGAMIGAKYVACSKRVSRHEALQFGIHTIHIPNWCDPSRISISNQITKHNLCDQYGISREAWITVSIANESPLKNLHELFKAVTVLDDGHHHFHVGEVTETLTRSYLNDKIHFVGSVTDIARYLAAADAFVCSSTFEGGPLVLMEAAMSGVICICTPVGISEEFAQQTAFILTEPNHHAISKAIQDAKALPPAILYGARRQLRDFALTHFSPKVGASKYFKLYCETASITNYAEIHH